ncbi:hypothetical protein Tco_1117935 [Tanacetum coccineum]
MPYHHKEPVNSLSMGDEHLDTILANESDEVIKSSVENLVPIPSEFEGIPDSVCDVPLCNNPTSLEAFKEHSETIIDSNDDSTSSDDDSYENIDYVDASPPDAEIVALPLSFPCVGFVDELSRMSRILEASRARGICPSITRASNPQLHFGNPDILILSTNVYLLAYFINGLRFT